MDVLEACLITESWVFQLQTLVSCSPHCSYTASRCTPQHPTHPNTPHPVTDRNIRTISPILYPQHILLLYCVNRYAKKPTKGHIVMNRFNTLKRPLIPALLLSVLLSFITFGAAAKSPSKVYLLVDSSGSMKWSPQWLGKVFEDIDTQLSGVPQWQLYSFTTETKLLHKGDMIEVKEAAQTMEFKGGREDGLAAIEKLLKDKMPAGSHIMLFTDEKRSKIKDIDFDNLLKTLKENKITLHTFLFHRPVAEKAQDGFGYVQNKQGKPVAVSLQQNSLKVPLDQHNPVFKQLFDNRFISEKMKARIGNMPPERAKQFAAGDQEYIKLALLSGGYAWGLPLERHAKQIEQNNTKMIGRVMGAKMMNKSVRVLSAKVIVTGDTLTGLNMATQMITFDASDTGKNDVDGWEWDFNGDDEVDDYGPSVYTQFDTPGDYRVKLWLIIGEERQLQNINLKVVE